MSGPRIALVSPSFWPMVGGVEAYVLGVGSVLSELGYEITVYTPDSVLGRRTHGPDQIDGIKIRRIRVFADVSYRLRLWPDLAKELVRGSPDLIHVYSHDSYALLALLASRSAGVPFVITTYGPFEKHSDYGLIESGLFRAYDSLVSPGLLRRCDCVMIRYPAIARWLTRMSVSEDKIRLEPSGIPRSSLRQRDGSDFRSKHGIEGPLVVYLGRISPQKGLLDAVGALKEIVRKHPKVRLGLIGPDYEGYGAHVRKRAFELGVADNLLLLPPVTDEEEQLLALAACDVFIMPSAFEGFSQAVMKAMAQGRPVVVTNVGGLPYEVGFGKCGLVCRRDPGELGRAVNRLLSDSDLSTQLGNQGREKAKEFTFDIIAGMVSQTYSQLMR